MKPIESKTMVSFNNPDRPLAITAVCIIGLINAVQMLNLVFSPMAKQLSLICVAGLWLLKRWAAITYIIILICNQIALAKMGFWEISAAIIPLTIIGVLIHYFRTRQNQ